MVLLILRIRHGFGWIKKSGAGSDHATDNAKGDDQNPDGIGGPDQGENPNLNVVNQRRRPQRDVLFGALPAPRSSGPQDHTVGANELPASSASEIGFLFLVLVAEVLWLLRRIVRLRFD